MKNKRVVATRLHTNNEVISQNITHITKWCHAVLEYCDILVFVVDHHYDVLISPLLKNFDNRIIKFLIDPWISYTQPLNMLVEKSLALGAKSILFQSIEVDITATSIDQLYHHLTSDTLVVGAKMHDDHAPLVGIQKLEGWITPWNTLALWDLKKLGITGFLSLSGGHVADLVGGVEEVPVISLLQQLRPNEMKAKIVEVDFLRWEAEWSCENRMQYHQEKMQSKNSRASAQMHYLGIQAGEVIVINKTKGNS